MIAMDSYVKTFDYETHNYRFVIHIGQKPEGGWRAYIVGENKGTGHKSKVGTIEVDQNSSIDELVDVTKKELDTI